MQLAIPSLRPNAAKPVRRGPFSARTRGITIIELLIAIVIFAVALLLLAFVLTSNFRGVRIDNERTVANQVAVSVVEQLRDQIAAEATATERVFDSGVVDSRTVNVDGQDYVADFEVVPVTVAADGSRSAPSFGVTPDAFEVTVDVATPEGESLRFDTVVAREPE